MKKLLLTSILTAFVFSGVSMASQGSGHHQRAMNKQLQTEECGHQRGEGNGECKRRGGERAGGKRLQKRERRHERKQRGKSHRGR